MTTSLREFLQANKAILLSLAFALALIGFSYSQTLSNIHIAQAQSLSCDPDEEENVEGGCDLTFPEPSIELRCGDSETVENGCQAQKTYQSEEDMCAQGCPLAETEKCVGPRIKYCPNNEVAPKNAQGEYDPSLCTCAQGNDKAADCACEAPTLEYNNESKTEYCPNGDALWYYRHQSRVKGPYPECQWGPYSEWSEWEPSANNPVCGDEYPLHVEATSAANGSVEIEGITIERISGPSDIGGTTNYVRTYTSPFTAKLRAPATGSNGEVFDSWGNCDSVSGPDNRDCTIAVSQVPPNIYLEKIAVALYWPNDDVNNLCPNGEAAPNGNPDDCTCVQGNEEACEEEDLCPDGTPAPGGDTDNCDVNPPVGFNYSLSNSGTVTVARPASGNVNAESVITKTLTGSPTSNVNITASGIPSGVSVSYSNRNCSPTCTSPITFTVLHTAPLGTFPITVTGTELGKTTSFNLVITQPSGASVTCAASPVGTALVGQPVSWSASASGGTPPYTYTWSGTSIPTTPAPTTNPYSISYSTIGLKVAQATARDANGVTSTCAPQTILINFNPSFQEF